MVFEHWDARGNWKQKHLPVDVCDGDLTGVSGLTGVLTGECRGTGYLAGVTGGDSTEEKGEALWLTAAGKAETF